MSIFFMHDTPLASPLPLWERSDRIARCDPGEGFLSIDRPEPLTPTLSHKGRGGSPSSLKQRSKHLEILSLLPVRHLGLEALDLRILDVNVVVDKRRAQR